MVALYVHGLDLDPAAISSALGLLPTHAHVRGDVIASSHSDKTGMRKGGLWKLEAEDLKASLEEQVVSVLRRIAISKRVVAELPGVTDAYLDIFAASDSNVSFNLEPTTVALAAKLGLAVQVTFSP